jgi:hypothetical protein
MLYLLQALLEYLAALTWKYVISSSIRPVYQRQSKELELTATFHNSRPYHTNGIH